MNFSLTLGSLGTVRVEELMNSGRANVSVLSDCLRSIAMLRTFLHMYNKDIADVSQVLLLMLKDLKALLLYIVYGDLRHIISTLLKRKQT